MMEEAGFRLLCRRIGAYDHWLQRIPGDGNCFFGSLVHQIHGVHPKEPSFSTEVIHMRASIVAYLRSNFSQYWTYLVPFAEDFVNHDYTDVYDRVWKYLELLSHDGFWGGEVCLTAACVLYNVKATVWEERTGHYREYPNASPSARGISLYYTGAHYDSLLFSARTDLRDLIDSVDIPRAGDMLRVVPFCGQFSVYQSFLHQMRVPQDESSSATLRSVVLKYLSFGPISHSGSYLKCSLTASYH